MYYVSRTVTNTGLLVWPVLLFPFSILRKRKLRHGAVKALVQGRVAVSDVTPASPSRKLGLWALLFSSLRLKTRPQAYNEDRVMPSSCSPSGFPYSLHISSLSPHSHPAGGERWGGAASENPAICPVRWNAVGPPLCSTVFLSLFAEKNWHFPQRMCHFFFLTLI